MTETPQPAGPAQDPPAPVDAYLDRICASGDFPAFTAQLHSVIDVLRQEDTPMQSLANIVLKDYSLTLKVLRTANSWHYNRSGRQVLSVTQAMVLLGVENVRDLATSLILVEHFQGKTPGLKELMALSMLTASHARAVAEHVGFHRPEEAHLAGMFRNLGEVAMACHAAHDYTAVLARVAKDKLSPGQACHLLLQFTFEDLGAAICRQWGLAGMGAPGARRDRADLDRMVAFGHDLTTAVYRQGASESPMTLTLILQRYGHDLSLTPDLLQSIMREAMAATQEVFDSLNVSITDLRLARHAEAALKTLAADAPDAPPTEDSTELVTAAHGSSADQARAHILQEIDAALSDPEHFDLTETMLTVLEALLRSGPFSRAVFCLLTERRNEISARFGLGDGVDGLVARLRIPLTIGPQGLALGQAMLRKADLLTSSARNPSGDEARLLGMVGARSVVLLPIVIENKAVGALYADRVTGDPPDAGTVNFAHHLREQAVRALVRARRERESVTQRSAQIAPEDKSAYVLRLLRGEPAETISRETGLPMAEVEAWRQTFLDAALQGLKSPKP